MIEVQRHDPAEHPDHGRPRIATFVDPGVGALHVHVDRKYGTLTIFAIGPAGGDRGQLVVPRGRVGSVATWLEDCERGLYGVEGVLYAGPLREDGARPVFLYRGKSRITSSDRGRLRLLFDPEAFAALRDCFDAWQTNVVAAAS